MKPSWFGTAADEVVTPVSGRVSAIFCAPSLSATRRRLSTTPPMRATPLVGWTREQRRDRVRAGLGDDLKAIGRRARRRRVRRNHRVGVRGRRVLHATQVVSAGPTPTTGNAWPPTSRSNAAKASPSGAPSRIVALQEHLEADRAGRTPVRDEATARAARDLGKPVVAGHVVGHDLVRFDRRAGRVEATPGDPQVVGATAIGVNEQRDDEAPVGRAHNAGSLRRPVASVFTSAGVCTTRAPSPSTSYVATKMPSDLAFGAGPGDREPAAPRRLRTPRQRGLDAHLVFALARGQHQRRVQPGQWGTGRRVARAIARIHVRDRAIARIHVRARAIARIRVRNVAASASAPAPSPASASASAPTSASTPALSPTSGLESAPAVRAVDRVLRRTPTIRAQTPTRHASPRGAVLVREHVLAVRRSRRAPCPRPGPG